MKVMEAVSIRANKPRMKGNREWTNEPRLRRTEGAGGRGTTGLNNRRGASNNRDTRINGRSRVSNQTGTFNGSTDQNRETTDRRDDNRPPQTTVVTSNRL